MSIIAAGTTTTTALSSTGNTDGTLQFQVNGTTASVTLNALGAVGVGSTPSFGTAGQVLTSGGSTVAPTWTTISGSSQWVTSGSDIYYNTGSVGINTTTPTHRLNVSGAGYLFGLNGGGTSRVAQTFGNTGGALDIGLEGSTGGTLFTGGAAYASCIGSNTNTPLQFGTNGTIRATLDSSGRLLIATSSSADNSSNLQVSGGARATSAICVGAKTNAGNTGNGAQVATSGWLLNTGAAVGGQVSSEVTQDDGSGSHSILIVNRTGSNGDAFSFRRSGTTVGSVTINSSSTSFNTSSDYRLKNTIAPMTGALAKVAQLKPVTYKWNSDDSNGQGFIAHELAEVVPECVTGEKDAINPDGTIKPQGIDTSFLVATLTAAIQEQQAMIAQLQADVAALKGQA